MDLESKTLNLDYKNLFNFNKLDKSVDELMKANTYSGNAPRGGINTLTPAQMMMKDSIEMNNLNQNINQSNMNANMNINGNMNGNINGNMNVNMNGNNDLIPNEKPNMGGIIDTNVIRSINTIQENTGMNNQNNNINKTTIQSAKEISNSELNKKLLDLQNKANNIRVNNIFLEKKRKVKKKKVEEVKEENITDENDDMGGMEGLDELKPKAETKKSMKKAKTPKVLMEKPKENKNNKIKAHKPNMDKKVSNNDDDDDMTDEELDEAYLD